MQLCADFHAGPSKEYLIFLLFFVCLFVCLFVFANRHSLDADWSQVGNPEALMGGARLGGHVSHKLKALLTDN